MSTSIGDAILILRRSSGMTQEALANAVGITQVALSRYENGLRTPNVSMLGKLAEALGVTIPLLRREFRMRGAIAVDAHMRRPRTAPPADWKRIEARLNALRMQSSFLLERTPLTPTNSVAHFDPDEYSPDDIARLLRAAWRMPIGPVRNLTRWVESAGILVAEEDFGTHRIDGMSQWAGSHAVVLLNVSLPTSRKRWTLAHELGHLVMHTNYVDIDVEEQANQFAEEFLMPEHVIRSELRSLTLGKLADLKREWGTSMQVLSERALHLSLATSADRQRIHQQLNSRGWKTNEPGDNHLPSEVPELITAIGQKMKDAGLTDGEIKTLAGAAPGARTRFLPAERRLQAV